MRTREWLLPLVLGVLTASGGYTYQVLQPPAAMHDADAAPRVGVGRFVLAPAPDAPAGPMTLLDHEDPSVLWRGTYGNGTFTITPKQRCGDVLMPGEEPCDPPDVLYPSAVSRPPEAGFGQDGQWLLRATILVFRQDGVLVYGNADDATTSQFRKGDYTAVPHGPFYLGSGPAPASSYVPSPLVQELFAPLREQLIGLPVGSVASAELDSQTVRDVHGKPLYATARIDWLGRASG